ncbi:TatD-related deoxyribonuclease [Psychromonas sp. CNPT3]|uniref:TatD family hydrolase n=1 Tax=Psychromonas sp. CNPT3 TaxID=314282 RepID=UPI0002C0746E|nr:TatD family hydrolase [Psychromonas sp. CNPT3]AGH81770.1 TatD-related deoxyribonuclease [Psychromonas sp. CNPT3]
MFIDSHCHLDFNCFSKSLLTLLNKLQKKEITKVLIPGTQANAWEQLAQLSQKHEIIYYALGLHPHFLHTYEAGDLLKLKILLKEAPKKCVALGEIGLDKFATATSLEQETIFREQLQLAEKFKLPIILHCVKKQGRVLEILKSSHFSQGGVYHGFSGSLEVANEFISLGFKLGIGGLITNPKAKKIRECVAHLPLTSFVLETDAPDMLLYQQKESINTPLSIIPIFECINNLRNEGKYSISTQLYKNTLAIFPKIGD